MISCRLSTVVSRFRNERPSTVLRYAMYRLNNAFLLWRYGIGSAIPKEKYGEKIGESSAHVPTSTLQFLAFRTAIQRYVGPKPDDVLLDYGSGLGGAILMAATLHFRRIIGVEYSADLNVRASEIFARHKSRLVCNDVEFVTVDATRFDIPPDVTVIYCFNPFWGAVLQGVIAKIRQSLEEHPREIKIIWFYDPLDEVNSKLAGLPSLRLIGEVKYPECVPSLGNTMKVFTCSAS